MSNRRNCYKLIFEKFGKPDSKIQSQLPRETQQQSLVIADSQNTENSLDIRHNSLNILEEKWNQKLKIKKTLNVFLHSLRLSLLWS